ncbi:MAG: PAS-domain containing protein, partial [Proteobacteria bacterium]|nr:PAS-domain containing protein [Pseudomonadota bacterium]
LVLSGEVKLGGANYSQLNIATHKDLPHLISILSKAMNVVALEEIKVLRQRWISVGVTAAPKAMKLKLTDGEKAWLAEHKHIRLGVDPAYPPFDFIAEDGTYSGMGADYARLIGERLGVTMEVVPGLSWSQVLDGVKSGAVDVLPVVTKTPERVEYLNFTKEYLNFPDVIFMREDHDLIAGLSDMKGRKMALVKGYSTTKHIETNYPSIGKLIVGTPLQALRAVAEGKAEGTVQNLGVATYLIKKHGLSNLVVAAPIDLEQPGFSFGVRKDWPELVPILDKVLASIKPEEETAIRVKWGSTQYQIGIDVATVRRWALRIGGAGAVIFIVIFMWNRRLSREVKQRKQAEEVARKSEARLVDAIESISDGFIYYDADERLVLCNQKYRDFYPWIADALEPGARLGDIARMAAESGQDAVASKDVDGWVSERISQFREGRRNHEQHLKDGRWLLCSESPTEDGGVVGIRTDITERKRAEAALSRAREAAEAAESRLMDAIENISEGFALFDADKRIILCNNTYRDIYGYDDEDTAPGTTLAKLTQLDIERGVLSKELGGEETLRRRAEIYGDTQESFNVPLADGRWVQIRDRPTSGGGTVSVHSDITERKRAEAVLTTAKDEAEALAQSKSDFVAVISHEVRTPMNGVLGMARLLEDMNLDAEQRECVNTIVSSGEALLTIIDDLLDISKIEAHRLELERVPFQLSDVIADSMTLMKIQADEKGLALSDTIDPEIPPVLIGDPHRLRQVLLNLLSNAIKFTEEGSVSVEVTAHLSTGGDAEIVFAVTDTGRGISADDQEKLFSDYTQASVEVARLYGGTGLGLAICRRLVDMMGGEIAVESTVGEGSTFSFAVSFAVASEADAAKLLDHADDVESMPAFADAPARSLKVLQVEDNEINRDVAEKILTRAGHRVVNVENGVEALAIIETGGFDVVLMDRDM